MRKKKTAFILAGWITAVVLLSAGCNRTPVESTDASATDSPTTSVAAASTTAKPTLAYSTTTTTATPTTATQKSSSATTVYTGTHFVQKTVSSWELRLVNPWNPLPDNWNYEQYIVDYAGSGKQFDSRAVDALRSMINDGAANKLQAVSLYRPYSLQVTLFNRQLNAAKKSGLTGDAAEAKAASVVARPGTSEHHLGLAVDILGNGQSSLEEYFDKTPAFAWLKEHCAEYGFILRYPKEKESITGVIYEPWHYRYVGVPAATEIMQRGITLEEYLEELQNG